MIFRRFYDESLAQASYLIGCEKTREAIVVDPGLGLEDYARAAAAERVRISHVTETHIHADFVSGAKELAEKVGCLLSLSGEGGNQWTYSQHALSAARVIRAGSRIDLGSVTLEALHTPGHTAEHITLLVTDRDRGEEPVGALTGDFIFVGDVGRPDLLERAAGAAGSAQRSAAELFRSIQDFRSRPDHLQLWPGHGAGSACGKWLGSLPQTTLGYERLFNWAFSTPDEREFVKKALEDQPVPPRYFAEMKKINREAAVLPPASLPSLSNLKAVTAALEKGATIVDTRPARTFAESHVPGTINIPLGKSFLNWIGALVPYDRDLFLILDGAARRAAVLAQQLRKIGLTRVAGYTGPDIIEEWARKYGNTERVQQVDVRSLDSRRRERSLQVVDVRSPDEWSAGHLPGALHIPLAALPERIREIDASAQVVVQCQGGGRSAIAASFMLANGVDSVANLEGGYDAWTASGLPVETDA
ncbi:MAG: rhodanese-like domain-containing protein [Gemmatimonadaceae bacterium]